MSEPTNVSDHLTLTAFFGRKVNLGNYESTEGSIFIQRDVPVGADGEVIIQAAREAFTLAKTLVLDELGIDYTLDEETGVIVELKPASPKEAAKKLEDAFGAVPDNVTSINDAPSAQPAAPAAGEPPSQEWLVNDQMQNPQNWWDNREGKKNPKAPDFKHRKNSDWVIWPPRKRA